MGKPLQVAQDIVPINEFKTKASQLLKRLHQTNRPMVITQNGRPSAVVMTPEEFDLLTYQQRFLAAVQEGIEDADAGRVYTTEEVRSFIAERLKK